MQTAKTQQSETTSNNPKSVGLVQRKYAESNTTASNQPTNRLQQDEGSQLTAPQVVHQTINAPGRAIDPQTLQHMESRFHEDFSDVAIHTSSQASESAKAISASAYTVGKHIAFASGEYRPGTPHGNQLLAHELTHVLQQRNSGLATLSNLTIDSEHSDSEAEADQVARNFEASTSIQVSHATAGCISRQVANQSADPIVTAIDELSRELNESPPIDEHVQLIVQRLSHIDLSVGNRLYLAHAKIESAFGKGVADRFLETAGTSQRSEQPGENQTKANVDESKEPVTWAAKDELAVVKNEGSQAEKGGANLRIAPSPGANLLAWLPQNTKVLITRESSEKWIQVMVMDGKNAGLDGYLANWLVLRGIPDPASAVYTIKPGDSLGDVVQNHPQYKFYDIRTGDDARSLVVAVLEANKSNKGVALNQKKLEEAQSNFGWLDFFDDYRATLRPIYRSVELTAGETIWLPGRDYIQSLKQSGAIPQRSEAKNAAIAVTKGAAGFTEGIAQGFGQSVGDAISGIGDILSQIRSILSGEALETAREFISAIMEMSAEDLKEFGLQAVDSLKSLVSDGIESFIRNWNSPSPYNRWNFRGRIVGYVLAEIAIMLVSGGVVSAIKWVGKFAKIGGKIVKLLEKLRDKLEKVIPDKKRSDRDRDSDRDPDKKGYDKERLAALTDAKVLAEIHDNRDSPIPLVMSQLMALKIRHPVIKSFREKEFNPGHHIIKMRASPEEPVDHDYTPSKAKQAAPEPKESEVFVHNYLKSIMPEGDWEMQQMFVNEENVTKKYRKSKRNPRGSTIPDTYSKVQRIAVEVKTWSVPDKGFGKLLDENVIGQQAGRIISLPKDTKQWLFIDMRGQGIKAVPELEVMARKKVGKLFERMYFITEKGVVQIQ